MSPAATQLYILSEVLDRSSAHRKKAGRNQLLTMQSLAERHCIQTGGPVYTPYNCALQVAVEREFARLVLGGRATSCVFLTAAVMATVFSYAALRGA